MKNILPLSQLNKANIQLGGVTERLNVPVLKTGEGATLPWVRIPPPPPEYESMRCHKTS